MNKVIETILSDHELVAKWANSIIFDLNNQYYPSTESGAIKIAVIRHLMHNQGMGMIQDKIDKLIPYIDENFITYPLGEEGKYIPFVRFWFCTKNKDELKDVIAKLNAIFNGTGYVIDYYLQSRSMHHFTVSPDFTDLNNGSYEYVKKDWSIEEMLDLLADALAKVTEREMN